MKTSALVATCLTALVTLLGVSSARAAEPFRLRVLTYNIKNCKGNDGVVDVARVAAVIKQAQPDVVLLQEVDKGVARSKWVDQPAELGRLTGLKSGFARLKKWGDGDYGNAMLSRFPAKGVKGVRTLLGPDALTPSVIGFEIRPGAGVPPIFVIGAHLNVEHADLRLAQAQELTNFAVQRGGLVILGGDMNAKPGSPPIALLRSAWTDATAAGEAPTFPATKPRIKIDYIFCRPADAWRVVETRVIEEPMAADHCPVLVVLEYRGEPAKAE
ncbi:endonuclease/exonuclease/phosphatase family protein [Opitutus sp. ER46]|uniref:endonuclease/exonuclease/phosphatase family protein n=1 Tax=Opitutus sp. ER46 TaxID=2161864 RepID=UPI000D2F9687|nr:endonuclease/exonuclease/phosphatase family protein [Opitutus sp. ER46]PTX94254.1 endonuclease [Opitutus sp. ER46]